MTESTQEKLILLVEDNPYDADLTKISFKRNGISNPILHVKNGEEALGYLFSKNTQDQDAIDYLPLVVVLDLKLPKVSGLEVLRHIRNHERTRKLPVIVLTSSKEEQDTTTCNELGVCAYMQKPVNFLDFSGAVKNMAKIISHLSSTCLSTGS
jgi:two-component system response regulator